ncbi:MAG TPA: zinc ribbon domain-containing protein [Actinomycetota bacterium]|nr:zinc ribbon domain-containing protein [Actinomycetota bacterium]
MAEARCPNCSALVGEDADWCGQCFTSLRPPAPEPGPAVAPAPTAAREPGEAAWPCPVCGERNPIELDACRVCGTPFASLLRQEPERPSIAARDAFLWSLIFPGVGHAKAGRAADGVARGTLFVLTFGLTLVIVLAGVSNAALLGVVALLLTSALTIYLGSAFEAYRIAEGGSAFLSARALLWATVGVIMLAVSLLAASVVTVGAR